MNIVEASEEDTKELKELARKAILNSVDANDELKNEIIKDAEEHIDKNIIHSGNIFLKCQGSCILGFILVQDYWNLSDLYVLPVSQGNGIGRELLNTAKQKCIGQSQKGYIRVNSSLNAEGFYRKNGFTTFTPEQEAPNFVVPLICNF